MEAVKMPKVVQPRGQARSVSGASSDAVKGSDEFMKLLQVKKDQPQPDKADNKQTEVKDSPKDPAEEIPQDKQEDTGDTQEQIPAEDTAGQDALLQAAMQQAAAQMTGIVTVESPQQPEVVEEKMAVAMETEDGKEASAEVSFTDKGIQTRQPEQGSPKPAQQPEDLQQRSDGEPGQEETGPKEDIRRAAADSSAPKEDPKIQSHKAAETQQQPQSASKTEEKPDSINSLYGDSKADARQAFEAPKTEEVPLKTSQENLPQDLGKMLANRFQGTGRELTVELEPANLGKLTIKLVYEAGKAAVSIMATNPKTLEILNQKAAEIASILEEKTGQETMIYTESPQQESQEEDSGHNHGGRGQRQGQEEKNTAGQEDRRDAETFAQQLRLGLV